MGFLTILKSLDDLLYEVVSWLIFYPVTLWRALTHPLTMMRYADTELKDSPAKQYPDVLSPPQFLLVTLLLSHAVELAVIGDSPLVASHAGLAALISDDTNLIVLRIMAFAIYPLLGALRMVRIRRETLDRNTLKLPFFAQCYAAAPMALLMSIGSTLMSAAPDVLKAGGVLLALISITWFLWLETAWFRREAGSPWLPSLGNAVRVYVEATAVIFALSMAMR